MVAVASGVLLGLGYRLFSDGMGDGQSYGKRVARTRVVDAETGDPCTLWQSGVRHASQCLGLLDYVFIFGETRRRLGDRAANTVVVKAT